jgi:hypothetical protein
MASKTPRAKVTGNEASDVPLCTMAGVRHHQGIGT